VALLGVIGGSGFYSLEGAAGPARADPASSGPAETPWGRASSGPAETPWGPASGPVEIAGIGNGVAFLARHGAGHKIAPHRINYRANIHALKAASADRILAVGSVGGIGAACVRGALVVPDQLIDYTWGREATFQSEGGPVTHVDFTDPYSPAWRSSVIGALDRLGIEFVDGGTYAAVQGPRFETAAEVRRLAADGCSIVGMTGMPEAVLAREAGLDYAAVCPVGNLAAGISTEELRMDDVVAAVGPGMERVTTLIEALA